MAVLSYRQKIMLGDRDPVVFIRGERSTGVSFFAYLALSLEQLTKLNCDMERGVVRLGDYGRVILQGEGEPTDDQKNYMTQNYAFFDHNDPFADNDESAAAVA